MTDVTPAATARSRAALVAGTVALAVVATSAGTAGCGPLARLVGQGEPLPGTFDSSASAPADAQAAALVARMTADEKVGQLVNAAAAIPRLGVPAYDWWNESLHGVGRNGSATVFPQAIALAATFDEDLLERIAEAIAAEARAKLAADGGPARGTRRYEGLTFFAPNINIFRDPRWGRGQETYGEDPVLTARLAVAYVRGLQGPDPDRLRAAAVAKHFAVHSGPEGGRFLFDARASARDLADTYLPQFEAVVREGGVSGIMAAYNRLNGQPCVANPALLEDLLRKRWGFTGFVVGDCGAVGNLVAPQRVVADPASAAALALRSGTDLDCGVTYRGLRQALRRGLITEADLDRALVRLFAVRFRAGLLGHRAREFLAEAQPGIVGSERHRALAREAAQKGIVLLENDGTLPIAASVRKIAVVGPAADDRSVLLGNYHGTPIAPVTFLAGLRDAARARGITVRASRAATYTGHSRAELREALSLARWADLVVAVVGLNPKLEGEEGEPGSLNPTGDRRDLDLPGLQPELLRRLVATRRPIVTILTTGSALSLPPSVLPSVLPSSSPTPSLSALLVAFYPGEAGGTALADLLFGSVSPSGRLPVTFYRSADDLPALGDYHMEGRTYRYFRGRPLYPFGSGRSYASIRTDPPQIVARPDGGARVRVSLLNTSSHPSDEVVTVFVHPAARRPNDPLKSLAAFRRVSLPPNQPITLELDLRPASFTRVEDDGRRVRVVGPWNIQVGLAAATFEVPPLTTTTATPRSDAGSDAGAVEPDAASADRP